MFWVGEPVKWSWNLKSDQWPDTVRIDPRICYINVPKCLNMGIRYFDEHHMAGLWNPDKYADSFDTGGWLYEQTKDLDWKEIKKDEYVVHFGGGSYNLSKNRHKFLADNSNLYKKQTVTNERKKVKSVPQRQVHPLTIYSEVVSLNKGTNSSQPKVRAKTTDILMEFRKTREKRKIKVDSIKKYCIMEDSGIDKNIVSSAIARAKRIVGKNLDNPKTIQEKLQDT